jgi:hypothetical protein
LPRRYVEQDLVLTTRDSTNVLASATLTLRSPAQVEAAPQSHVVDARLTVRLILTVPMEFIGFEARDGMCLTTSAQLGDKIFHSEPLSLGRARPNNTH